MRYYAGRWVCQKPTEKCDGTFYIYDHGRRIQCPLADRCLTSPHRQGQIEAENLLPRLSRKFGKLIFAPEPEWEKKHMSELKGIQWAFATEEQREIHKQRQRKWYSNNREYCRKMRREKYHPCLSAMLPGYVPQGKIAGDEEPPCGGDCRNCPYESCRYPDWEGPLERRRKKDREYARKARERRKERMAQDPEYAAREKEKERKYQRKYYQKKKAIQKKLKEES